MIYKRSEFYADINTNTVEVQNKSNTFYTADKGTSLIRIYVTWNKETLNLDDYNLNPQLNISLNNGVTFTDESLTYVDRVNGIIDYEVPNKVIVHAGRINAKLFLKNDNQKVHVANFSFNILESGLNEI